MITVGRNVLVVPYTSAWAGGPDHQQIPHHGRIVRGNDAKDSFPDELRTLPSIAYPGHYLYGGPLKNHFGHVMVDSIIRLWAFDRHRHQGVVFACLDMPEPPQWLYDIVWHFGLMPTDIVIVKEPSTFRELDFAEPGCTLKNGPKEWYLERLELLPVQLVDEIPGEKLYFGRTHIIKKGTLMGESYFSGVLDANGFASVRPEEFGINVQLSMLSKASHVVFMEGSSIYSIELLAKTSAQLFMIPRRASSALLFAPHLSPKASAFAILGVQRSVTRQPNRHGNMRPNSPSYIGRPDTVFQDLVKFGLIQDATFDPEAFSAAERYDAKRYFA